MVCVCVCINGAPNTVDIDKNNKRMKFGPKIYCEE